MNGLVDAAVEGRVALIAFQTSAADVYRAVNDGLVDSAHDLETLHFLHLACAHLEDGVTLEGRIEVYLGLWFRHDEG